MRVLLLVNQMLFRKKKDDKIMSGSIVTSGTAYAKVIGLTKDSYASSLVKDAASVKDNTSYLQNTINKILKIITFLIVPVGILLFISQYFRSGLTYKESYTIHSSGYNRYDT